MNWEGVRHKREMERVGVWWMPASVLGKHESKETAQKITEQYCSEAVTVAGRKSWSRCCPHGLHTERAQRCPDDRLLEKLLLKWPMMTSEKGKVSGWSDPRLNGGNVWEHIRYALNIWKGEKQRVIDTHPSPARVHAHTHTPTPKGRILCCFLNRDF